MLAGPLLDADGLIAPSGAGAGIHPSDILEHVGSGSRPRHFQRFAVLQIRHWKSSEEWFLASRRGVRQPARMRMVASLAKSFCPHQRRSFPRLTGRTLVF